MMLDALEYIFKNAGVNLPENFMPVLAYILRFSFLEKDNCYAFLIKLKV
jgi:hypothetical protein